MADENDSGTGDAPQNGPGEGQQGGEGAGQGAPANGTQNGNQGDGEGKPNGDAPAQKPGESDADWKARARQHEDRAKAAKKDRDSAVAERDAMASVLDKMRKALDPDGAGKDDDPQTVAKRASDERDAARAEARLARVELQAERAARKSGADVDALLDSRSFLDRLKDLDPTADTFGADVEAAVKDALTANPKLKATPAEPKPPASSDMSGGGKPASTGTSGIEAWRKRRRER